ncbi:MAG: ABC transporter permease [Halanaerobiales bacterium]|nr:ABC transporter permease [Halanaerobiales bacterium]
MIHAFGFAFKMMKKRPLRMSLTLLQVAAGGALIIIVLSLVFAIIGDQAEDEQQLTIESLTEVVVGNNSYHTVNAIFSDEIVSAFKNETNYLEYLTVYESSYKGVIEYDNLVYIYHRLLGVSPAYREMIDLEIVEGDFFTQTDLDGQNKVMVISKEANQQLFGSESGVGRTIGHSLQVQETEGLEEWKIIGIYFPKEQSAYFHGLPHFIVPYSQLRVSPYRTLMATVKPGKLAEAKHELEMIFKHQYLEQGQEELSEQSEMPGLTFSEDQQNIKEGRKMAGRYFGLVIGSFALVALVISSIGILSMMLVSIVERTREIGLRRSLGASRLQILGQILAESVMLSFVGGLLGIGLAFILVKPIMNELISTTSFLRFLGIEAQIFFYPILISLGSIVLIGLMAGLYPGFQASRIIPVEAIREN